MTKEELDEIERRLKHVESLTANDVKDSKEYLVMQYYKDDISKLLAYINHLELEVERIQDECDDWRYEYNSRD